MFSKLVLGVACFVWLYVDLKLRGIQDDLDRAESSLRSLEGSPLLQQLVQPRIDEILKSRRIVRRIFVIQTVVVVVLWVRFLFF
jgi:hypothetical protein